MIAPSTIPEPPNAPGGESHWFPTLPAPPALPRHWRVLLTGITAIHGWPLFRYLNSLLSPERLFGIRPPKMKTPDEPNVAPICISDHQGLERLRDAFRPTHVIHCAGVCDLDVCESRPDWAHRMNTAGTRSIAQIFGAECYLLFVSTDLVFSGNALPEGGYAEVHPRDPLSVVGRTFAEAEDEIFRCPRQCVIRLGLPLGDSITGNKGAQDWIESRLKKARPVTLFTDEYRSCIHCAEINWLLAATLARELTGLFHLGGPRPWSLHEIGRYVLRRGPYSESLLKGILRCEELDGPPRVGNVALNSSRLLATLAAQQ